jgi:transcriptional regulator
VLGLVEENDFVALVHAAGEGDVSITHVPVLLASPATASEATAVDGAVLEMHLARANPLNGRLAANPRITVMALGPFSYITPLWYETPGVVPTWNYATVHLHCEAAPYTETDRLHRLFDRTATFHEPRVGGGWNREGDRQVMVDKLIRGVVGYDLTVRSHEATFKMSQNKSAADREGVIRGLRGLRRDRPQAVADMMIRYLEEETLDGR